MSEPINRMKCDCRDCHSWLSRTITIDVEWQIGERHLCAAHFEFLASVYPHMLNNQPSPVIAISGAEIESFLQAGSNQ